MNAPFVRMTHTIQKTEICWNEFPFGFAQGAFLIVLPFGCAQGAFLIVLPFGCAQGALLILMPFGCAQGALLILMLWQAKWATGA
jgi:uncharacterized protein (DUF3820 family)